MMSKITVLLAEDHIIVRRGCALCWIMSRKLRWWARPVTVRKPSRKPNNCAPQWW
jgi:hypothetical protein